MILPRSFELLQKNLEILPGVGEKTAERYVYSLEKKEFEDVENLADALIDFKKTIKRCESCFCLSDYDTCPVCSDESRNNGVLCIVEDSKTAFAIEKTNKYKGRYFVLNGLISPIDGVNPEDLNIHRLVELISNGTKEVIIALNGSIESEVTSLYIQKKLENIDVKVSRLAYGIPVGLDIEYLDPIMISKALDDRKVV